MIEEFEKGFRSDVQLNENTQGGKVSFTAEVQAEAETSTKRQKIDRWITPSSAGYEEPLTFIKEIIVVRFLIASICLLRNASFLPFLSLQLDSQTQACAYTIIWYRVDLRNCWIRNLAA